MTQPATQIRKDVSAKEYIQWLFQATERVAILTRNRDRGETAQRIASVAIIVEPPFQCWLQYKNEKQGSDIYVGMNPLRPEARARKKTDILAIRHLYVDLDRDAAKSLEAIERSNLVPQPNAVVHTSPSKMQVVWEADAISQDQAESLLRSMARKFERDPAATDSTHVLRLPGFRNHKYDEEFIVRVEVRTDRVYNPGDFRLKTDLADHEVRPVRSVARRLDSSQRPTQSQSEHDWAFAKRTLAKGTPAEEVIRQIAAFRASDKHNPEDYARRTVTKALAELREAGQIPPDINVRRPYGNRHRRRYPAHRPRSGSTSKSSSVVGVRTYAKGLRRPYSPIPPRKVLAFQRGRCCRVARRQTNKAVSPQWAFSLNLRLTQERADESTERTV
jgi:RepB DNA-primase from phage plasmid